MVRPGNELGNSRENKNGTHSEYTGSEGGSPPVMDGGTQGEGGGAGVHIKNKCERLADGDRELKKTHGKTWRKK